MRGGGKSNQTKKKTFGYCFLLLILIIKGDPKTGSTFEETKNRIGLPHVCT